MLHACMHACMYVCLYVCMYVCIHIFHTYTHIVSAHTDPTRRTNKPLKAHVCAARIRLQPATKRLCAVLPGRSSGALQSQIFQKSQIKLCTPNHKQYPYLILGSFLNPGFWEDLGMPVPRQSLGLGTVASQDGLYRP